MGWVLQDWVHLFIHSLRQTWLSCSQWGVCVCLCAYMRVSVLVTRSYLILCKPMDCSLPDSPVHGIGGVGGWVCLCVCVCVC